MVALPAVLVSAKLRLELLAMLALPAVLALRKFRLPLLVMAALPAVLRVPEIHRAADRCW